MAIWYVWNTTGTTTANTTSTWNAWNTTTSSATSTSTIWNTWAGGTGDGRVILQRAMPSEAELERHRQAEAAREEAYRKQREAEEAADKRAEELLMDHLNGRQRRQYRKDKSFTMVGRDGNRYRVTRAWGGHVLRINKGGKPLERWCVHPDKEVPLPDNQLIAKLMLEANPEEYRRIANVTPMAA